MSIRLPHLGGPLQWQIIHLGGPEAEWDLIWEISKLGSPPAGLPVPTLYCGALKQWLKDDPALVHWEHEKSAIFFCRRNGPRGRGVGSPCIIYCTSMCRIDALNKYSENWGNRFTFVVTNITICDGLFPHHHSFTIIVTHSFSSDAFFFDIVCNLDSTSGWHSLVARQWCILDWFLYKSIRTISTVGCDCGSLWYGRTVVTIRITVNCVLYQSK